MTWISLFLPWMLMVHNTVDFRENGAQETYMNALNYTVTQYVDMLEENNHIKLVNKTGRMGEKISHLKLLFESYDRHDTAASRQMILGLIYSFLDALNKGCHGRLRPFLCPYPFTPCNIEIGVNYIDTCKYPYPTPGTIKYVSFADGMITYSTEDPRCLGRLELFRQESLCLARQLAPPVVQESPYCMPTFR